jgi:hypothetical protein
MDAPRLQAVLDAKQFNELLERIKTADSMLYRAIALRIREDGSTQLTTNQIEQLEAFLTREAQAQERAESDAELARLKALEAAEIEVNTREAKVKADAQAAIARLNQYEVEQGLLSSDKNVAAIRNFIETSETLGTLKGHWTPATVDNAIAYLSRDGRLEFAKKEASKPVAPPLPVNLLPNGEPELPLNADAFTMKNASVTQLRDLSKRRGEGRARPTGSFAGRF